MMNMPFGYRFNPTEEELISYYLKNKITGTQMLEWEYSVMIEGQLYGENQTPWELMTYENQAIPWQFMVDSMGKLDDSERVVYVFTQLSNVGKTEKSDNKQKSRVAGCGTWHGNSKMEPIFDNNGKGSIKIGYRRTFTFRSSMKTVGQWTMYEYSIDAPAHGIPDGMSDYVLCKIKRNDSRCSKDGKIVSRKRNANETLENLCDEQQPAKKERSEANTSYSNENQVEMFNPPSVMAATIVDNDGNGMCYSGVNQGMSMAMDQQFGGTYSKVENCDSGTNQDGMCYSEMNNHGRNIVTDQKFYDTYSQDFQGTATGIENGDGSCSTSVYGAAVAATPGNDNGSYVPLPYTVDTTGTGNMCCNNPNSSMDPILFDVDEDFLKYITIDID